MQINLDHDHGLLVQEAVASGRATDATAYLQSLIEADAPPDMIEHRIGDRVVDLDAVLQERLKQKAYPQPADWRERVMKRAEQLRQSGS